MRILFIVLALIYGCFSWLINQIFPNTAVNSVREHLNMEIKPYYVEYHEDNRGWFGDGEEIVIFHPNQRQTEKIEKEWKKTPVDSKIGSLIFTEREYNGLELAKYIPEAEGYWFYKDRSPSSAGYIANFSFALYDGEKVYYYELDT